MRSSARLLLATLTALIASGCSFLTATGFDECHADSDCGPSAACARKYCLPLPSACRRVEGAFDAGQRIALAALVPLAPDGGVSERETARLEAMQLAVVEANGKGGLDNRPYGLFACSVLPGDENEDQAKALVEWLIGSLEVPAIIPSGSSRTRWTGMDPVRVDAGTFVMSANATSATLVALHQTYGDLWRVAPPDTEQAKVIRALAAAAVDGGAMVSIVYESTDYGGGFKVALSSELSQAGYSVGMFEYHPPLDGPSAQATVAKLAGSQATVVIGFPTDVALLAGAAAEVPALLPSAGHRWFLSDAAKDPSIAALPVLDGAIGTAPAQGKGLAFLNFRQSFMSRYGSDPNAYSFTAHSYDAMWLTLAATAWASRGGGAITGRRMGEAMSHLAEGEKLPLLGENWVDLSLKLAAGTSVDVEGSSGPLAFDVSAGAPSSDYEVWKVADGGTPTVTFVTPGP